MMERPDKHGSSLGSPHTCTRKELLRALRETCGILSIPKDSNLRAFAIGKIRATRHKEWFHQKERFNAYPAVYKLYTSPLT
jgi:hypothetical protein